MSKEIGYPHELIMLSLKKSRISLDDKNKGLRCKVFAHTYLSFFENNINIELNKDNLYDELEILYKIRKKLKTNVKRSLIKKLERLNDIFIQNYNEANYNSLCEFFAFINFIQVLYDDISLIKASLIKKIQSNKLLPNDSELRSICFIINSYLSKSVNSANIVTILDKINSLKQMELKIYFSYKFSKHFKEFKSIILISHYLLLKKIMETQSNLFEHKNLSDDSLVELFKISSSLYICGYNNTLRLNFEEKINYESSIIDKKVISNEFEEKFDTIMRIKFLRFFSIPIKWYILVISILILISASLDIFLPISIPLNIEIGVPVEIPISIIVLIVFLVPLIVKLFNAKNQISKKLTRDNNHD